MADDQTTTTDTQQTQQTQTQAKPWYDGLQPEYVGVLQTRGIDGKAPHEAVANLIEGYRNAEKVIGFPHDQVVRYNPADENVMNSFYERIGVPKAVDGYKIEGLKRADGSEPDADFLGFVRETALKHKLPAASAQALAQDLIKFADNADSSDNSIEQAKIQAEKQALMDNWGQRQEANMFIAKSAAAKLGIEPAAVDALEKAAGYKATMEMFLKLGLQMGEDKYVTNQNPNAPGVFSKEGASARLAELQNDSAWSANLMKGDASALREFRALTEIIAGVTGEYRAA